jgi:hypothetical protein
MSISALASLYDHDSTEFNSFYHTSCFQAFVFEVEETLEERLEERLTEISVIAMSRVSSNAIDILCILALNALLNKTLDKPKQYTKLTSALQQQ